LGLWRIAHVWLIIADGGAGRIDGAIFLLWMRNQSGCSGVLIMYRGAVKRLDTAGFFD
jgi:hypothetical protein